MGTLLLSVYGECIKTLRIAPSVFILWATESNSAHAHGEDHFLGDSYSHRVRLLLVSVSSFFICLALRCDLSNACNESVGIFAQCSFYDAFKCVNSFK